MHYIGLSLVTAIASAAAFVPPTTQEVARSGQALVPKDGSIVNTNRIAPHQPNMFSPPASSKTVTTLNFSIDPQTYAYANTALDLALSGLVIKSTFNISKKIDDATENKIARAAGEVFAAAAVYLALSTLSKDVKMIQYVNDDFNRAIIDSMREDPNQDIFHMSSQLRSHSAISDQAISEKLDKTNSLN